jgi:hypothetical protein
LVSPDDNFERKLKISCLDELSSRKQEENVDWTTSKFQASSVVIP